MIAPYTPAMPLRSIPPSIRATSAAKPMPPPTVSTSSAPAGMLRSPEMLNAGSLPARVETSPVARTLRNVPGPKLARSPALAWIEAMRPIEPTTGIVMPHSGKL